MTTFMERFRAGQIQDDEVEEILDVEIARWHSGNYGPGGNAVHMWEHLGMTYEEFHRWVTNPNAVYAMKERT